jgi:hypothetical protein
MFVRDFKQAMRIMYIDYYIYLGEYSNAVKQYNDCLEIMTVEEKDKFDYRMHQMDPNNQRKNKITFEEFLKHYTEIEKREQEIDALMIRITEKVIQDIEQFFKAENIKELKTYKKYAKKMLKSTKHLMYKNLILACDLLIKNLKIAKSYNNTPAKNNDIRFQINSRRLSDLIIRFNKYINNKGD